MDHYRVEFTNELDEVLLALEDAEVGLTIAENLVSVSLTDNAVTLILDC